MRKKVKVTKPNPKSRLEALTGVEKVPVVCHACGVSIGTLYVAFRDISEEKGMKTLCDNCNDLLVKPAIDWYWKHPK